MEIIHVESKTTRKSPQIYVESKFSRSLPNEQEFISSKMRSPARTPLQSFRKRVSSLKSLSLSFRSNSSSFDLNKQGKEEDYPVVWTHSAIGTQRKNEDRSFQMMNFDTPEFPENQIEIPEFSAFAVIDGHGGVGCADFLESNLGLTIQDKALQALEENKEDIPDLLSKIVLETINSLENDFIAHAKGCHDFSGACIVLALCYESYICVANVGDCLAVFYTPQGKCMRASTVHRCTSIPEMQRISKAGGQVDERGRMFGCLFPSRSLGDLDVKLTHPGVLIATPSISILDLQKPSSWKHRPFLILASDGIWDFMSTKQAAKIVKNQLKKNDWNISSLDIAKDLVEKAIELGSQDDTTATVILF
mmetsp:Transcript_24759/g.32336  ORF Transcript_24759/g.32336 Transcript_24759/m.32336 type:complete len:363 (+) Transcript_24759:89-1177(+)|eukprot:CAMPEP_0117753700 /NCGR_PEP_ID=MMETSP0947-20121206/12390_1 /TAXON_ID=44440 /ORGANISM="Chattonella subsalsa, Strain CCMP2191" /LENGTH=362 /DNA_ID=CAMNT_0005572649 /DNA_START=64 /DNA_END=1152 /DNA_ORIENTATION=+